MSNLFKNHPKKIGAALGLTAFGIQYFTSPALIQLATTTFAGLMSSFLPPAFALIGGLALTAALHIVAGIIIAAAISRLFMQQQQGLKARPQLQGSYEEPASSLTSPQKGALSAAAVSNASMYSRTVALEPAPRTSGLALAASSDDEV